MGVRNTWVAVYAQLHLLGFFCWINHHCSLGLLARTMFDLLPRDVHSYLCTFLSMQSMLSLASVSKRWSHTVATTGAWPGLLFSTKDLDMLPREVKLSLQGKDLHVRRLKVTNHLHSADMSVAALRGALTSLAKPIHCLCPMDHLLWLGCRDGSLVAIDNGSGQQLHRVEANRHATSSAVTDIKFLESHNLLTATTEEGCVMYYPSASQSGDISLSWAVVGSPINQFAIVEPAGDPFLVCALDSGVVSKVHIEASPNDKPMVLYRHAKPVYCVACQSTDPNVVVSGGFDRTLFLYDTRSPAGNLCTLTKLQHRVYGVAMDGHKVIAGDGGGCVLQYDLRKPSTHTSLRSHRHWVEKVSICNGVIVSCSGDGAVGIGPGPDGTLQHCSEVWAFTHKGDDLFVACKGTVYLWPNIIKEPRKHDISPITPTLRRTSWQQGSTGVAHRCVR